MKHVLIINASKDFAERMMNTFNELGVSSQRIRSRDCFLFISKDSSIELFHKNEKVLYEDSQVFMRLRGHDEHFTSLLSKIFLAKNIPVNDPIYAEHALSNEKVSQMVFLALSGLPAPSSILCTSESYFSNEEAILDRISFPCVVKSSGSKGKLVWEVKTKEKLKKLLFRHGGLMLIQEYIPNTFDIRILTYKEEVLGAIKRSSGDGFYNNVSKGGTTGNIELTDEEEKLAIASAKACGVDFAGVDIVRSERGPLILEVNNGPQIVGFEKQTGINIPSEIAKRIAKT